MAFTSVLLNIFILLAKEVLQHVYVFVELLYSLVLVLHLVRLILLAFVADLSF